MRKLLIPISVVVLLALLLVFTFKQTATSPARKTQEKNNQTTTQPVFNKQKYSLTDPTSLWVIVSKSRTLSPIDYAPGDLVTPKIPLRSAASSDEMKLRTEAASALETMTAAAKKDGAYLKLASGYRSYGTQVSVYGNEVTQYGKTKADSESARPGHSEHQSGLAADLQDVNGQCVVADCFGNLTEGKWVSAHAWEYGFLLRYPADKVAVTGYRYESWHVRYVGKELATELHRTNTQTLEEFFGVVEPIPY